MPKKKKCGGGTNVVLNNIIAASSPWREQRQRDAAGKRIGCSKEVGMQAGNKSRNVMEEEDFENILRKTGNLKACVLVGKEVGERAYNKGLSLSSIWLSVE